ncbi:DUF4352 domain-containing protein [Streptomyces sp. JJ66]|uniref:DUF4352 domain-containing protein n=1 Tax=Streptomyces sp. JJ66 TaxID=2803843 RepID=UPI001C562CF2|nr:DUF4352 domain-containing protein [Streptomyces sp. JJ66]MBW1602741.1 DUF4352 domain-containing protein [Streptomyces sp. JJ66]
MSVNTTRARTLVAAVATAVLAVGGLTACGDADEPTKESGNSQEAGQEGDAKDAGAEDAGDAGDSAEGPYAGGDTAVYDSGLKVTVSTASPYQVGETDFGHTEGNEAYQVTITLENTGEENVDADLVSVSARAGEEGTTVEEIYGDKVGTGFTGTVLPGKKATAGFAYDVPADAKVLDLEVELFDFSTTPAQWSLSL